MALGLNAVKASVFRRSRQQVLTGPEQHHPAMRVVLLEIVPDCSRATLQGSIRGRVELESVIHSTAGAAMTALWILAIRNTFASSTATKEI